MVKDKAPRTNNTDVQIPRSTTRFNQTAIPVNIGNNTASEITTQHNKKNKRKSNMLRKIPRTRQT